MNFYKNIAIILIASFVSFIMGYVINKKSEKWLMIEAEEKARDYMDSILSISNNLNMINYRKVPYNNKGEDISETIISLDGYVPDEKAAVRIAVSIWSSLYGEKNMAEKYPFEVSLKGDSVWFVKGSLPPGSEGGIPIIGIAKSNGTILFVNNGK